MATTVDDLIYLKDDAVAACAAIVAAWEDRALDVIEGAVHQAKDIAERAELYDAADQDDQAVSIEDYERLEALCEDLECPMRDPHKTAGHKIREHPEENQ